MAAPLPGGTCLRTFLCFAPLTGRQGLRMIGEGEEIQRRTIAGEIGQASAGGSPPRAANTVSEKTNASPETVLWTCNHRIESARPRGGLRIAFMSSPPSRAPTVPTGQTSRRGNRGGFAERSGRVVRPPRRRGPRRQERRRRNITVRRTLYDRRDSCLSNPRVSWQWVSPANPRCAPARCRCAPLAHHTIKSPCPHSCCCARIRLHQIVDAPLCRSGVRARRAGSREVAL